MGIEVKRMMPDISIIIPVYNVEKYLPRCLQSILDQVFKNFEVILVDDGSTDQSGIICDRYVQQDRRFQVIHKKNEGVSIARNIGIEIAKGEFITFVDSDDYCDSELLAELLKTIKCNNADLVQSGYLVMDEQGNEVKRRVREESVFLLNKESDTIEYIIDKVFYRTNGWEVWSSLFRRDIIQKEQIKFCVNCNNFAEDLGFFLEYLLYCKCVTSIMYCGYRYVQHIGSMMANSKNQTKVNELNEVAIQFGKRFFEVIKCYKNRRSYAIIYYLIMDNQYRKVIVGEKSREIVAYDKKINNIKWHDKWMRMLFWNQRKMNKICGREYTKICVLNSRYFANRNWKKYSIESLIAWKLLINLKGER